MSSEIKKLGIISIVLCMIYSLILYRVVNSKELKSKSYKITINRIHNRFSENVKLNDEIVSSLNKNELGIIEKIDFVNYNNISEQDKIKLFSIRDYSKFKIVFLPVGNSNLIVKYYINNKTNMSVNKIVLTLLLLFPFLIASLFLIYLNKYYLEPIKKLEGVPERIVRAYFEDIKIEKSDILFNKFFWGLDLLQKEITKEKKRRIQLEKEKNTLTASLSHDIKTPLASIKNYAILLKDEIYESKEDRDKAYEVILEKSQEIEKLSKKLLNPNISEVTMYDEKSQNEEIYFSKIYGLLNKIIEQKIELFKMNYSKKILENDWLIYSNLELITQVFENIIENALKYGDLNSLTIDYYMEDYYQIISIANSGSKVPQNELKYIFSEYYRGSNIKDKTGYGLGLSICKKIMQNMEGNIYAENTAEGFKLFLVFKYID